MVRSYGQNEVISMKSYASGDYSNSLVHEFPEFIYLFIYLFVYLFNCLSYHHNHRMHRVTIQIV